MNVRKSILETVGSTPLVEISPKLNRGGARVLVKIESFNPAGSAKDRAALDMVLGAERRGELRPGGWIIEPTSGNTGIALAMVAAVRGYRLALTMPDTMSVERIRLARAYGAEVVLTPGAEGMTGAIARAEELKAERGGIILRQFANPDNASAHLHTTGPEIWSDSGGTVDVFVAGVGTGGTLSGTAEFLKEKNPAIEIVAVEPSDSPLLSQGTAGAHKIQGIGANFIPEVLRRDLVSKVMTVSAEAAGDVARRCAAAEGILVGISSGAALSAALALSDDAAYAGKTIVALLPDSGERYLSTWLFE